MNYPSNTTRLSMKSVSLKHKLQPTERKIMKWKEWLIFWQKRKELIQYCSKEWNNLLNQKESNIHPQTHKGKRQEISVKFFSNKMMHWKAPRRELNRRDLQIVHFYDMLKYLHHFIPYRKLPPQFYQVTSGHKISNKLSYFSSHHFYLWLLHDLRAPVGTPSIAGPVTIWSSQCRLPRDHKECSAFQLLLWCSTAHFEPESLKFTFDFLSKICKCTKVTVQPFLHFHLWTF